MNLPYSVGLIVAWTLTAGWFVFCVVALGLPSALPGATDAFLGLSPTAWSAFLTFMLVVVAAIQVGVYVQMHRANAATQRGWINIESLWLNFPNAEHPPSALVGIRNAGGSPAFITSVWVRLLASASPMPAHPVYEGGESPNAPAVLNPSEATRWRHYFTRADLDESDIDDLVAGVKELWLFGKVEYLDIFREQREYAFLRRWDRFKSESELRAHPDPRRKAHGGTFAHVGNRNYNRST